MKLGALVALGTAEVVLGFARAELTEILGRLRDHVLEELKRDAAQGFA